MAIIKVSRAQSANGAINYALGENKLKSKDKQWLKDNNVNPNLVNKLKNRAVTTNSYGVSSNVQRAKLEMKASRDICQGNKKAPKNPTEAMRFIQSFSKDELSATQPKNWKIANNLGLAFAKKVAPNNQSLVFTQYDSQNHILHNHIVTNAYNLKTNKKYHHSHDVPRLRKINDTVMREHGFNQDLHLAPHEHRTISEVHMKSKGKYVWKDDLRHRIDRVMQNDATNGINEFNQGLQQQGVKFHNRNKSSSFSFTDKNNKQRRIRGRRLGSSYEKEHIFNELGRRIFRQRFYQKRKLSISSSHDSNGQSDYRQSKTDYQKSKFNYQKTKRSNPRNAAGYQRYRSRVQKRTTNVKQSTQEFRSKYRRLVPKMEYNVSHIDDQKNREEVQGLEAIADSVARTLQSFDQQIQSAMNQVNYAMNEYMRNEKKLEQEEAQDEAEQAKQDQLEQEKQDKINRYYRFHGPSW